jgi:Protein of unknown function (DUF2877)
LPERERGPDAGGVLPAHRVAAPVLERLRGGRSGTLLGAGATAAWVDLGGFVLAVTTREVPLLPNAVGLTAGAGALGRMGPPGAGVRCGPGRVQVGGLRVVWDPADPPVWDPAVPVVAGGDRAGGAPAGPRGGLAGRGGGEAAARSGLEIGRAAVERRGDAVLAALGVRAVREPGGLVRALAGVGLVTAVEPEGAAGVELLLRAVLERDAGTAAEAAGVLLGRGPGLTPEGDDLLAAVAGTLVVLGPVVGLEGAALAGLAGALVAADGRTTGLAATLLELAGRGLLAEPAGRLLDLGADGKGTWRGALGRLERLGHGSGRAYGLGIGAAAWLLALGGGVG